MNASHEFGGNWTDRKVEFLAEYLKAYQTVLKNQSFRTSYVDAFAGTGYRTESPKSQASSIPSATDENSVYEEEATDFQKGSAVRALETPIPFDRYVFIEKKAEHIQELQKLEQQFPDLANRMFFRRGEANAELQTWCKAMQRDERAVVFLDPYGMTVEWRTIEALAQTNKVDLWILFPIGMGINRMLLRSGPPEGAWSDRITTVLGTNDWKTAFYQPAAQTSMLDPNALEKVASFDAIGAFFLNRLRTIFSDVAPNPYYLRNSKNTPLYLLCFAASNRKGAEIAVRIAKSVLAKKN